MKNYLKNLHNSYMSACQSDISDSETGQILSMVIMFIQSNINPERKLLPACKTGPRIYQLWNVEGSQEFAN